MRMEEGWGDMRPGDRVYHYYIDTFSLCGKVGFYPMDADHITEQKTFPPVKQKSDCSPCFKKMVKWFEDKAAAVKPESKS